MSVILTGAKGNQSGKNQSRVEAATVKQRSPTPKLDTVRQRSEILTEQWKARRKGILLNPKGLPRLTVAKLIEGGRK